MHSPIIRRIDVDGAARSGDLYETFAALSLGMVDHLTALRPHQSEIWHVFSVQVAVLAIERSGLESAPTDAAEWRRILHALTPAWPKGEPWNLVVEDASHPALLQPAISPSEFKKNLTSYTPDQLDVLVSGRNHEIKSRIIDAPQDDDWLFALLTLQTSEGSMGGGAKAVSRINGGFASRTTMRFVPPGGMSASFLRDVGVLLRIRAGSPPPSTPVILWAEPWKGTPEVAFQAGILDPLYVEICRRVRLVDAGNGIQAQCTSPARSALVTSDNGVTSCPWTPIVLSDKGSKSFSPGPVNDYRVPATLLDRARTQRPLLAEAHAGDPAGGEIRIQGLRRGQGATERLDVYRVPLPNGDAIAAMALLDEIMPAQAADYAKAWTITRTALMSARQGAPDRIRFDDAASSTWADEGRAIFGEQVNQVICADPDLPAESVRHQAADIARATFQNRVATLPGATTPRGLSTTARSHGMLEGMLHKYLKGDSDEQ